MIMLSRLNGPPFAVNPDLIQRAEGTPDTVITLVDGTRYVVAEPVVEVISRIRDFRASVIALAQAFETAARQEDGQPYDPYEQRDPGGTPTGAASAARATVVRLHRREV